jgi:hypothetical protein
MGDGDIWVAKRERPGDPWGEPVALSSTVNSSYHEMTVSISRDGLELYFSSDRPGGQGAQDIWITTRRNLQADWASPTNLGPIVNTPEEDSCPTLSPDGLLLFLISDRPGGYGQRDIWVSTRPTRDDPWSQCVNLGPPINTAAFDQEAYIWPADSVLYFTSSRPDGLGGLDIWQIRIPERSDYISGASDPLNSVE